MKKIFFLAMLSLSTTVFAQNSNKDLDELHKQMEKNRKTIDSSMRVTDSIIQQRSILNDSAERERMMESNARNLNALVSTIKEREDKARQRMWWRVGIGIALLVLGIVGVTRRKKIKNP